MTEPFIISDTHFGHANVLEFERENRRGETIAEHDQWLVSQINSRVTDKDVLWILGDAAWNAAGARCISQINGTVSLIPGNHDHGDWQRFRKMGFSKVRAMREFHGEIIATHVPINFTGSERWRINLHGHLHSQVIDDPRYVNCCVEQCGGVPRTLEEWTA